MSVNDKGTGNVPTIEVDIRLDPVWSPRILKNSVIEILQHMPETEDTHRMCMYFLRALDNPSVLLEDMHFLDKREQLVRQRRTVKLEVGRTILAMVSLIAGGVAATILAWVTSLR
jgi:hypothetical protein